ncbi:MAG: histidinol dehydrogenase, partial [Oscillospiraceae bacterium]|nr:histidinol dehydrogenase [Oscillospiraceae bacterium]
MIRIYNYRDADIYSLLRRDETDQDVSAAVSEIIRTVRARGDSALFEYGKQFDGAELSALEVTREELDAAVARVEPSFIGILERAAHNIEAFHKNQIRQGFVTHSADGTVMGQKLT